MKKTLALCMIVKNEEDTLPNCLGSAADLFDEIVVVDTGSTDATLDIAARFTDKIFRFEWIDDFAAARNFAFSKARSDYLMWLDADDILLPDDADKLRALKDRLDGTVREVAARYNVGFDADGSVVLEYYRERIFLRSAGFVWSGRIHETIPLAKDCLYADFAVTHHKMHPTETGRNLRIFEKMKAEGALLSARDSFYYARELFFNARYGDAERELIAFLDRSDAFLENKIDACNILAECRSALKKSPLEALFRSFAFDLPRAEICCEIGRYFYETGKTKQAIYWYEEALKKTPNTAGGAFVKRDCYGFLPLLQLCVLYYAEGDRTKSIACNNAAAQIKPNNAAVLFNKKFFDE